MSLDQAFAHSLREGGDSDALEQKGMLVSWDTLRRRVEALDAALRADGIGERAIIGVLGRNRLPSASAFVGVLASRRCVALLNPFQPIELVVRGALAVGAATLLVEEEDLASEALAEGGSVHVIMSDGQIRSHRRLQFDERITSDAALVLATSGTTGEPKRISIAGATLHRALGEIEVFNKGFGDLDQPGHLQPALIQYSPLAHVAGALTLARGINERRPTVLLEKFDPHLWTDVVEQRKPRTTGLPPAMMKMVLDANPPRDRLASLVSVWSGSAPVDPQVAGEFTRRYNLPVLGNYGATEFCGAVATWSMADYQKLHQKKAGAVGRILPSVAAAQIRSAESGEILAIGSVGVLELKAYRVGPDWMATNDLAHLDNEGFLYLHGRADDVIIRGGFKVMPDRVAAALKSHPGVSDAVVVGIEDARLGSAPVAVVQRKMAGSVLTEAELIAHVKAQLPAYFAPVAVRFVSSIPRTPAMKVDRQAVRVFFADLEPPQRP